MSVSKSGRKSRNERITHDFGGSWSTASMDFLALAHRLFDQSSASARAVDGNHSDFALAGIPLLFSALRCFAIELNSGFLALQVPDRAALESLAQGTSDISFLRTHYQLDLNTADDLELLWQIRCEIVHPAHRPGRELDGTPEYLRSLRARELLQSTGTEKDFVWIEQLKSHRLFAWAFDTIECTATAMIAVHSVVPQFRPHLIEAFSRHHSSIPI